MGVKTRAATVFCLLFFGAAVGQRQPQPQESLRNRVAQLHKLPTDTAQVRLLRELGLSLIEKDSALSRQLLEEALQKGIALGDADAITNGYRTLGIWYAGFNHREKALEYYRASLQSASGNRHLYLMAGAAFNIGNLKFEKGEYDSCIDYYLTTIRYYESPAIFADKSLTEKLLDKKKSDLYSNMSSVFNTLKNLPKADEYIDKAIAIAEKYSSPAAANALAYYMQQKADNFFSNGDLSTALRIRLQYLPQLQNGGVEKAYLQDAYQSIAGEYVGLDRLDSAQGFAEKSLTVATEIGSADGSASANLQLGKIALRRKAYQEAAGRLAKCGNYFSRTEDPVERRTYVDLMRQLTFAQGRYKEAYGYFETYSVLNDSILNGERAKQFSEREARYQSENKDNQIKLQAAAIRQKNTLAYVLAGLALVVILVSALAYRNHKQRQRLQQARISELETEKQLAATEAVLQGEEKERTRLAKDLHDGLGGMLSGIKYSLHSMKGALIMSPEDGRAFERSIDMLDSSIQEMRRVAHNLMPESLVKFGLDAALRDFVQSMAGTGAVSLTYQSVGMDDAPLPQTTAIAVYRITQELVNNVLKHAAAKTTLVQLTKTGGQLSLTVEDDGKGFEQADAKGFGWTTITNRVAFLKGTLDLQSEAGKGTSVFIQIPLA